MQEDIRLFLHQLCRYPHRGAGTAYARAAAEYLSEVLIKAGFQVEQHRFSTPATYVPVVYWLLGGVLAGMWLSFVLGWPAVLLTTFFAAGGLLYLDWRPSFLIRLPPLVREVNVIGRVTAAKNQGVQRKVTLMAHYDTAPVSALYRKQTAQGFRNTLRISMLLLPVAVAATVANCLRPEAGILWWFTGLLSIYFIAQGITSTIGYWQRGFVNGASDNATGVAAAFFTARQIRQQAPEWNVELVFTSAEEAGMIGALHYLRHCRRHNALPDALINFDTLGRGSLKVITQTGSLTTIRYNNALLKNARSVIAQTPALQHVGEGVWHTADFDSAWFARAGVPCLTLAALDEKGCMPGIHRPEDVLDTVDIQPVEEAVALAVSILVHEQ